MTIRIIKHGAVPQTGRFGWLWKNEPLADRPASTVDLVGLFRRVASFRHDSRHCPFSSAFRLAG